MFSSRQKIFAENQIQESQLLGTMTRAFRDREQLPRTFLGSMQHLNQARRLHLTMNHTHWKRSLAFSHTFPLHIGHMLHFLRALLISVISLY